MKLSDLKEHKKHGTDAFPVAMYASQWFIPYQWHEEDEFIYMLKGQAEYNVGGKLITLKAGECAFCSGRELHSMILEENQEIYFKALLCKRSYLFGTGDICRNYFDNGRRIRSLYGSEDPEENKIISAVKKICGLMETRPIGYELDVKLLFIEIYSRIIKNDFFEDIDNSGNTIEKNLFAVVKYIHSHFDEKLYVDALAEMTGYSTPYFERFFKEHMGKTPFEYIMMYRLNMAEKYLKETDLNILEISESCGFTNASYFIREFKKYYRVTPYHYRKQYQ